MKRLRKILDKKDFFMQLDKNYKCEKRPVKPKTIFRLYDFTFFTHWQELYGWRLTNKETGFLAYENGYHTSYEEKEFLKDARRFLRNKGKKNVGKEIKKHLINYEINI